MTFNVSNGSKPPLSGAHCLLPNFEISWAGEYPTNSGFCFGSEDGKLLFTTADRAEGNGFRIAESGEAINGVAFLDHLIAVSTPGEVIFFNTPSLGGRQVDRSVYDGGAHGIISTSTGKFVAPLGRQGLLLIDPKPGEYQPIITLEAKGGSFNFYRTVEVGAIGEREVLACALRHDGWAIVVRGDVSGSLTVFPLAELDVVDICSMGTEYFPHAAVAVGFDRTVFLIQSVLDPEPGSKLLRFHGLKGTAYSVMSARGHIILLTSESLYLFPNLASRFLSGQSVGGSQPACCLDLHAVDASVAYDRWLLIVMPDGGVTFLEVEHLASLREKSHPYDTISAGLPECGIPRQFDLSYAGAHVSH